VEEVDGKHPGKKATRMTAVRRKPATHGKKKFKVEKEITTIVCRN